MWWKNAKVSRRRSIWAGDCLEISRGVANAADNKWTIILYVILIFMIVGIIVGAVKAPRPGGGSAPASASYTVIS